MDSVNQNKTMCKIKSCVQKLCSMRVKDKLDFSLKLTAPDEISGEDAVCFDKSIKSETDCSLTKALCALLTVGVCIWLLCFLWSLCSVFKKK